MLDFNKLNLNKVKKVSTIVKYGIELECIRSFRKIDNKYIGSWMKDKCILLGPTFIKIGQFLSTRKDIFGAEFTNELKDLQDNVAPFTYKELLMELDELSGNYQYIEEKPLASASIGQVHRAILNNGQEVVIKARRPGIINTIKEDFELVLFLLENSRKIIPSRRINEINILFEEYYKLLIEEIDFVKETKNMKQFNIMFKDTQWLTIPKVYEKYSNTNIITMEYIPSIKFDNETELNRLKYNRKLIADKLMESYVKQIIDYGIVHIDLHQGNIGMTQKGTIVIYDYGMILKLDPKIRDNFNNLLIAIYEKDVNEICKIVIDLNIIIVDNEDTSGLKKFLYNFLNYLDTLDINNFKISYIDKIDQTNTNFMLSSKFLMLFRGITILEGICKELDNDFNYIRTLEPYVNKVMLNIDYIEQKVQRDFSKMINPKPENNIEIENLRENIKRLENKLAENNDISRNAITGIISFIILLVQYMK